MKSSSVPSLLGTATALLLVAAASADAAERKEFDLSTPYEQLTPAEIAAAKQAAKRRKITTLSVCADPGNMPLSDNKRQGFQNKIIEAVAQQLGAQVSYFWRPYLERGLTRETFANDECDILLDMPSDSSSVLTRIPAVSTVSPQARLQPISSVPVCLWLQVNTTQQPLQPSRCSLPR